jgi:hypothetical protein
VARPISAFTYKGFNVCVVPGGTSGFKYEVWSGGRALVRSHGVFVSRDAARAAAHGFIDKVERRLGLGPSDGQAERDGQA